MFLHVYVNLPWKILKTRKCHIMVEDLQLYCTLMADSTCAIQIAAFTSRVQVHVD